MGWNILHWVFTSFTFVVTYSPDSKRVRRTMPASQLSLTEPQPVGYSPVLTQISSKECCHGSKPNRFQMMESDFFLLGFEVRESV